MKKHFHVGIFQSPCGHVRQLFTVSLYVPDGHFDWALLLVSASPPLKSDTDRRLNDRPFIGHGEFNCNPVHTDDPGKAPVLEGQVKHVTDPSTLENISAGQMEHDGENVVPD